jgi:hypothetical protein
MLLPLLPLAAIVVQAWAWRRLRRRVASGATTNVAAVFRYAGWAVTPLLLFAGLFFGAVGVEELTGAAVVSEPFGRVVLPVAVLLLAFAVLGWVAFLIRCVAWR